MAAFLQHCAPGSATRARAGYGGPDASVVALADRHRTVELLCTDERLFRTVRGINGKPFRLLPLDA